MNNKKSMGEILYDLLPQLYKVEDAKQKPIPYPLKRYLQVAGVGLDFMLDKIEGNANMFDLDKTPPELLPHIAKMMGFEFPYDMTEKEQRNLLKVLPILYKLKGTQIVFDYLARQIFGLDAKAYSEWISRGGLKRENLIEINVEASGELSNLQTRIDRYYKYSELFRPVNHKLFWKIILYYTDVYNRQKILEEYGIEQLFIDDDNIVPLGSEHLLNHLLLNQGGFPLLKGDVYDIKSKYAEELIDTAIYTDDDISDSSIRQDELVFDSISGIIDNDVYNENLLVGESFTETVIVDDNFEQVGQEDELNEFILNNTNSRIWGLKWESYNPAQITESFSQDLLLADEEDVYNNSGKDDSYFSETATITDTETYSATKDDSYRYDVLTDLTNCLNVGMLNSTILLSKKPAITVYQ